MTSEAGIASDAAGNPALHALIPIRSSRAALASSPAAPEEWD